MKKLQTSFIACVVVLVGIACASQPCRADGKFYSDRIPPELPYQRATIQFDGTKEVLLIESKLEPKEGERFGWVIPVPSVPELAAPDPYRIDAAYGHLERRTRPIEIYPIWLAVPLGLVMWIIYRAYLRIRRGTPMLGAVGLVIVVLLALAIAIPAYQGYEILKVERVGPYQAKVLQGDSASALVAWFAENKFPIRDRDKVVIDSYVKRGWVFVAAKLDPGVKGAKGRMVPPLQLTFRAAQAVYPLALTGTGGHDTEILLYVFAASRMDEGGRLPVQWAGKLSDEGQFVTKFRGVLSPGQMGTDLVLMPAKTNASHRPVIFNWSPFQ